MAEKFNFKDQIFITDWCQSCDWILIKGSQQVGCFVEFDVFVFSGIYGTRKAQMLWGF